MFLNAREIMKRIGSDNKFYQMNCHRYVP